MTLGEQVDARRVHRPADGFLRFQGLVGELVANATREEHDGLLVVGAEYSLETGLVDFFDGLGVALAAFGMSFSLSGRFGLEPSMLEIC